MHHRLLAPVALQLVPCWVARRSTTASRLPVCSGRLVFKMIRKTRKARKAAKKRRQMAELRRSNDDDDDDGNEDDGLQVAMSTADNSSQGVAIRVANLEVVQQVFKRRDFVGSPSFSGLLEVALQELVATNEQKLRSGKSIRWHSE
jgi:hypothetical protein